MHIISYTNLALQITTENAGNITLIVHAMHGSRLPYPHSLKYRSVRLTLNVI